jgi:hypothetical protein
VVFHPAERTILMITAALGVADLFLVWWKAIAVGPEFFAFSLGFAALMICIGQVYRQVRDSERIALVTHILGLFVAFSAVGALFNILLLPRPAAPIDATLVAIDAWLGYSWPAMTAWFADHPTLNAAVRKVYTLTLIQLLVAFILLGAILDRRRLHAAALGTVVASLATMFCWALLPSGGAAAYWTLDADVERLVRPIVNSAYGAELNRLFGEGVSDLSALGVTGLIGFPSFHTVMALISLIAVWPYRAARYPMIAVCLVLFPGILVHGGHNLVDVLAGAAITAASWAFGLAVYDAQARGEARATVQSTEA